MTDLVLVSASKKKNTAVDVIFVHGMSGDDRTTWMSDKNDEKSFWPKWIDRRFKQARVYSAKLETPATSVMTDSMRLLENAKAFAQRLNTKKIGSRPVIFVVHSFGGIIVKKILHLASQGTLNNLTDILETTEGIFFIATPHEGSGYMALFRWAANKFNLTSPTEQVLEKNSELLTELSEWFSKYYSKKPEVKIVFASEQKKTGHSLVVDASSANPRVLHAKEVPVPKDHITICKPIDKNDIIYSTTTELVEEICKKTSSKTPKQSKKHKNSGKKPHPPASITQLINTLDNDFSFKWEKRNFPPGPTHVDVFWPVRLRRPTPIHAVQAFTAAAIQKMGARIHLYLDDLGTVDFPHDQFSDRLSTWFRKAGGEYGQVKSQTFKKILVDHGQDSRINPWTWARTLLGDTDDKMGETLRLSKLLPYKEEDLLDVTDLKKLVLNRPRRLLALPNVRACLDHLITVENANAVITLGGFDESLMWQKLFERTNVQNHRIANLYVPTLNNRPSAAGASANPLYMGSEQGALNWDSKEAIRTSFDEERQSPDWKETGRLIRWSHDNCVRLLSWLRNDRAITRLDEIEEADLRTTWVDGVAGAILQ